MTHQPPGEGQVLALLLGGWAAAHHLPGVFLHGLIVEVLHQHAAEQTAQLLAAGPLDGGGIQLQQPQVGLGGQ